MAAVSFEPQPNLRLNLIRFKLAKLLRRTFSLNKIITSLRADLNRLPKK
jgi:hypothetical protein